MHAGRWWQRGAGGGARGLGGMDRTSSGGHKVERKGQGTVEGNGTGSNEERLGQLRTWSGTRCMTRVEQGRRLGEGEPWLLLAMLGHTYYPLLIVNLLIVIVILIYE